MLLVLNIRINLFFKQTRSPHVMESKTVLDSGSDFTLWIPDSRYWILICWHWNLDSGFLSLVGFRISQVKFSGIPDSIFKAKTSRIPESRIPFMGRTLRRLAGSRRCFIFLFVFENFFFPHPYPLALAVNKFPTVFIFYHARTTNFEEKIEGL